MVNLDAKHFLKWVFPWFTHKHLQELSKSSKFSAIVERIATRNEYKPLYKRFVTTQNYHKLSYNSSFYLAMMSIQLKYPQNAIKYLKVSQKRAWSRTAKDKVHFWLYQLTQKEKYLTKLNESKSVNIYTLFAKNKLHTKYGFIKSSIATSNAIKDQTPSPYEWLDIYSHAKKRSSSAMQALYSDHNFSNLTPYAAYFDYKINKNSPSYFLMPYQSEIEDMTLEEQAFINAVAKQESRFIPPSLSYSYAMGVMQLMPFLIKAIAKQRKESVHLTDFFEPKQNIAYARHHLRWLRKAIKHPLFQAYSYNAGYGFTTRLLKKRPLFKGHKYDPYLSMELIINGQARHYGKIVLSNYYIYRILLGAPIKFDNLMKISNAYYGK